MLLQILKNALQIYTTIWKWNALQNLTSMLSAETSSSQVEVITQSMQGTVFILISSIPEDSDFSDQSMLELEWLFLSILSIFFPSNIYSDT